MREKYSTHRSGTYLSIWHTKTSNTNFCNLVLRLLKPVHLYVSNRRFFSLGYHQFLFRLHTINNPFIRFINNKKILWQTIQCDDLYVYMLCAFVIFFSHRSLLFYQLLRNLCAHYYMILERKERSAVATQQLKRAQKKKEMLFCSILYNIHYCC